MSKKKVVTRRWKPKKGAPLGPQETKLRRAVKKGARHVRYLFGVLNPERVGGSTTQRQMQQKIGAVAARHNAKVKSPHIVPGKKPATYCLRRVR